MTHEINIEKWKIGSDLVCPCTYSFKVNTDSQSLSESHDTNEKLSKSLITFPMLLLLCSGDYRVPSTNTEEAVI